MSCWTVLHVQMGTAVQRGVGRLLKDPLVKSQQALASRAARKHLSGKWSEG